jgi:hypothetical protein
MAKKKRESIEGVCLLCKKGPSKKDIVVSQDKDFVCSVCTQYLVEHPRRLGESIEEVLSTIFKIEEGKDRDEVSTTPCAS